MFPTGFQRFCPSLLSGDGPAGGELLEKGGPLPPEEVGAREGAVAADGHQVRDPVVDEVLGGPPPALPLAEVFAARRADDGAALGAGINTSLEITLEKSIKATKSTRFRATLVPWTMVRVSHCTMVLVL